MNNMPFIIIENNINLRLARILLILDVLSYSSKQNPTLTIENINVFDFLLRHPSVLQKLIKDNGFKKNFNLEYYEDGNIDSSYPNLSSLFDKNVVNKLLQILIAYNFATIKKEKQIIYYVITESGNEFLKSLSSDYIYRMKELSKYLLQIRIIPFGKIVNMINLSIEGDI